ncbi:MAG: AI-2E family transporter [Bacteroidaceae bacterium]|nr:AI-2E family transporter [Bacteroidaceae bacterium]
MSNNHSEISLGRFLRILLILIIIGISYFILDSLSSVLLPFFVAWLISYILYPAVKFFQYRLRLKSRFASILAVLILAVAIICGIIVLIVPSITAEYAIFKEAIVNFFTHNVKNPSIPPFIADALREYGNEQGIVSLLQNSGIQEFIQKLFEHTQTFVIGTFSVVSRLFTSCIVLLYLFFILLDYEKLSEEWKLFLPIKWRDLATKLSNDLVDGMNQYFRGQALVAFCVGILFSIGFLIIDFPLAIAFGLFVGVLNLVPYLQLVSLVPMVFLALLKAANTGNNFWLILLSAFIVLAVVQIIQDMFLVPKILGKRMNLHPAVILLSLAIWGKLLGILGMIVALPMTTLMIGYLKRYHETNNHDTDGISPLTEPQKPTEEIAEEPKKEENDAKS